MYLQTQGLQNPSLHPCQAIGVSLKWLHILTESFVKTTITFWCSIVAAEDESE